MPHASSANAPPLVRLHVVLAALLVVGVVLVPVLMPSRRSRPSTCSQRLDRLDQAIGGYLQSHPLPMGTPLTFEMLDSHFTGGYPGPRECAGGGKLILTQVGRPPRCSLEPARGHGLQERYLDRFIRAKGPKGLDVGEEPYREWKKRTGTRLYARFLFAKATGVYGVPVAVMDNGHIPLEVTLSKLSAEDQNYLRERHDVELGEPGSGGTVRSDVE